MCPIKVSCPDICAILLETSVVFLVINVGVALHEFLKYISLQITLVNHFIPGRRKAVLCRCLSERWETVSLNVRAEGTESLEAQRLPSHLLGAFGYVEGPSHRKCIAEEEWQLLTASPARPTAVKTSQLNLTSHSQRSCSPRMQL